MPLIDPGPPIQWHWQQAIGWIGFDLQEPPIGFNVFSKPLPKTGPEREAERAKRKTKASLALDELLASVNSRKITPNWRGCANYHPSLSEPDCRERMFGILITNWAYDSSIFQNLYFERAEILALWPAQVPQAGTISAQKKCEKWLSEELDGKAQHRKVDWWSKAKVLFPGLSRRRFDAAWAEAAKSHPEISKAGAKPSSSR